MLPPSAMMESNNLNSVLGAEASQVCVTLGTEPKRRS
jgi:hypothetical protein